MRGLLLKTPQSRAQQEEAHFIVLLLSGGGRLGSKEKKTRIKSESEAANCLVRPSLPYPMRVRWTAANPPHLHTVPLIARHYSQS